jgi:hypothetical protein
MLKIVKDVHLLGAAVDNKEVSKDPSCEKFTGFPSIFPEIFPKKSIPCSGNAIEHVVEKNGSGGFYNLYSSEDRILNDEYRLFDIKPALGEVGSLEVPAMDRPSNYHEQNVKDQIPPFSDADGLNGCDHLMCFSPIRLCFSDNIPCNLVNGTNHAGYFGFRNPNDGSFKNDGAIDIIHN